MLELFTDPAVWAALATLIVMEVVLGIDNLIFISVLTNKLPEHQQSSARRIGILGALVMRLMMLGLIFVIVGLTTPVFSAFGQGFSWRDLILIAGGLFLVWKATTEIHHNLDPDPADTVFKERAVTASFVGTVFQILLLDAVFSVDSILTAVGMTEHLPVMVISILVAITVMLVAADPLADFIGRNPSVVMLALSFLLLIGTVLVAEGFGAHLPKGYIYAAMAFSAFVEMLNLFARRARKAAGIPPGRGH